MGDTSGIFHILLLDGTSAIFHWGERREAPHGRYICDFPYIIIIGARSEAPHGRYILDFSYIIIYLGERSEPHMGDTSGIFHIIIVRTSGFV